MPQRTLRIQIAPQPVPAHPVVPEPDHHCLRPGDQLTINDIRAAIGKHCNLSRPTYEVDGCIEEKYRQLDALHGQLPPKPHGNRASFYDDLPQACPVKKAR